MMIEIVALFIFFSLIGVLAHVVTKFRIPLSGALPIAFATLIGFEALFLNLLSLFQAVNRIPLLMTHIAILGGGIGWIWKSEKKGVRQFYLRYVYRSKKVWPSSSCRLLLPLLIIVGLTAFLYPPNNYDTMTYHMARVAHWMQNGSISYYPTGIYRQNEMGPGAEYLVLFFQVITQSDKLSNIGQFTAFCLLIPSLGFLLRILRIPKRWAPYVIILSVSAPIAVIQPSNPKHDLIASLITLSIIISFRRLLFGNIRKLKPMDFVFIGVCIGSGYLVKPTSLIVAAPFIAFGVISQLKRMLGDNKIFARCVIGILFTILSATAVAGPDIYRKVSHRAIPPKKFIYPLFSEWNGERLLNPVKAVAQNSPFIPKTKTLLRNLGCEGPLFNENVFNCQEDVVGNPFQLLTIAVVTAVTLLLIPFQIKNRKALNTGMIAILPLFSWYIFGLIIKDQIWITRLQLPLFFLLPLTFVFLARIAPPSGFVFNAIRWLTMSVAYVALAYGFFAATNNPSRPLLLSYFWGESPSRNDAYYRNAGGKSDHDLLLKTAQEKGCKRIGLVLGPNSVEYPITWRAMQAGMETRHITYSENVVDRRVTKESSITNDWACMAYVATGVLEHLPGKGAQWTSVDGYHTHYRNLKREFLQSENPVFTINPDQHISEINPVHQIAVDKTPSGISMLSEGEDPHLLLPRLQFQKGKRIVIKINLISPVETKMQLFYKVNGMNIYDEAHSLVMELKKGVNVHYILMSADRLEEPLRFDPGRAPGIYTLLELEARELNDKQLKP